MKKLITFRTLKSVCDYGDISVNKTYCCFGFRVKGFIICNSNNCPVWKKLKEVRDDRR